MNKYVKHIVCTAVALSLLSVNIAYAKRFGGGKSMGRQNTNAVQRANNPDNAPPMQQNQNNQQQQNQAQSNPAYQQPAQKPKSNMGGILGGIAAGLGLAWLASKLGMGDMLSNFMMIGLLFFGFMMLMAFFKRKQQAARVASGPYESANAYSNSNPSSYSLKNTTTSNYDNASANRNDMGNSLANNSFGQQNSTAGFNSTINNANTYPVTVQNLVSEASTWFTNVQQLSDNRDLNALQALLSPELFAVVKADLSQNTSLMSHTVTQNLQSSLLDWRETHYEILVTMQYRANISEDGAPFESINEAWTFTQDKSNATNAEQAIWKLDGISQLN